MLGFFTLGKQLAEAKQNLAMLQKRYDAVNAHRHELVWHLDRAMSWETQVPFDPNHYATGTRVMVLFKERWNKEAVDRGPIILQGIVRTRDNLRSHKLEMFNGAPLVGVPDAWYVIKGPTEEVYAPATKV